MKHSVKIVNRLGLYIKRNYVFILSFFLPAIILEIAYITRDIFPFGARNILMIDLFHQYAPFISELQDKFRTFSSLIYSWSGGLGTYYLPLYAYYLSSPLNLIIVLFPKKYLTEAILVLTLLKIGLSGAFFTLYLKGVHREQSLVTVAFSLLYALSGYVLVFSWDIMWLDIIYLLPLIILGLVKLVRDGKGLFFCITLSIALLSNFYLSFFLCLFVLLYYPVCLFQYHSLEKPSVLIRKTLQFTGLSLLSAGLSSVLLLPTYFALKLTSAANDKFPDTLTNFFDLFDYITRHFTFSSLSIREGMPNLYCGIVVLILLPIYFLSNGIRMKEKLWHLAILLVLIVSFNINFLNFIWNGFHYPNQVPYRFSFVYIFLVLSMSYSAFKCLFEFSGKQIGTICLSIVGLILISQKFEKLSIEYLTVYVSVFFVILYAVALTVDHSYNVRPFFKGLILILVVTAEITTNTILTMDKIDSSEGYSGREGYSSGKEVAQIRDGISKAAAGDKDFYRMEIIPIKTDNDPFLYNYRGLSLFSSTAPVKPVRMMKNLGYPSNRINSFEYEGSTAILDAFFDIKYLIYRSIKVNEKLYNLASTQGAVSVFTNPYALPLGFEVPLEMEKFQSSYGSNPFDAQNHLMEKICGIKDLLIPIDQKQGSYDNLTFNSSGTRYYNFKRTKKDMSSVARVDFTFDKSEQVYVYFDPPSDMKGSGFVTVNGKKVEFNPTHSSVINLGFCESGTSAQMQVTFEKSSPESGAFEVYACVLDLPAFENAVSLIKGKSMTIDSFTDTGVRGHVDAAASGLMLMTIPYDKDWRVKIDNTAVKTQAMDDCLLSFEMPQGSHKVELQYFPVNFYIGLLITLLSILILVFLIARNIVKRGITANNTNKGVDGDDE